MTDAEFLEAAAEFQPTRNDSTSPTLEGGWGRSAKVTTAAPQLGWSSTQGLRRLSGPPPAA